MPAFKFEWDDFSGGFYFGPSEKLQPKKTWRGTNITIADDDATLVPVYQPQQMTLSGTNVTDGNIRITGTTQWSKPTYFNNYIVITSLTGNNARVHFINATSGAVTSAAVSSGSAVSAGSAPVVVQNGSTIDAYVAVGRNVIFKVTQDTLAVTTITVTSSTTVKVDGLTIWNARLIGWSTSSDTFYFSNASDFTTTWPTLNFIGVGYNADNISYIVPRNNDLMVVKPSGWYAVTGVLGINAAVRQVNDTIGLLPTDPVAQHNNSIYFTTDTGFTGYAVNLYVLTASRIDIAGYQRFGLTLANADIARTNMGYMGMIARNLTNAGAQYGLLYLYDALERWQVLQINAGISTSATATFMMARGQVPRFNSTADQYLYMCETYSAAQVGASFTGQLALHRLRPNTVEPGQTASSTTPSTGTVKLRDIDSDKPIIIKQIFVEAEMIQKPNSAYTGSASIRVNVLNKSVEDIAFSTTIGDPTTGFSTAYSFPFSSFSTTPTGEIVSQTRVMRFNVDNAVYGYAHEVSIEFAGMKIRRVWAVGDSR